MVENNQIRSARKPSNPRIIIALAIHPLDPFDERARPKFVHSAIIPRMNFCILRPVSSSLSDGTIKQPAAAPNRRRDASARCESGEPCPRRKITNVQMCDRGDTHSPQNLCIKTCETHITLLSDLRRASPCLGFQGGAGRKSISPARQRRTTP